MPVGESAWPRGSEWIALLAFATASFFGVHAYVFPGSNHCVSVPFILQAADPALFPGDPLLAERENFHTLYNTVFAWLVQTTGASVPLLFVAFFVPVLVATFATFFRLALLLGGRRDIAMFATAVFLFGTQCLGAIHSLEGEMLERTLVLPLELWALATLFERRVVGAFAALGFSFLIHPLSASYCFAASFVAALVMAPPRRVALAVLVFGVLALPVVLSRLDSGVSLPFFADPEWVRLLKLRSGPHVDYAAFSLPHLVGWAAFGAGYFWLARELDARLRRAVIAFGIGILSLWLAGIAFVDWIPVSLAVQMQLFRSSRFLFYVGLAVFARHLLTWERPWPALLALLMVLFGDWTIYLFPGAAATVFLWLFLRPRVSPRSFRLVHVLLLVAVTVAGNLLHYGVWIGTQPRWAWDRVQAWARANTPTEATFIVPPDRRGFRVFSHRPIYGDWKDGTQAFFNPAFGPAWLARMRRLGFADDIETLRGTRFAGNVERLKRGYDALAEPDFAAIAAELQSPVFAVVRTRRERPLSLPLAFEDGEFRVYRVRDR